MKRKLIIAFFLLIFFWGLAIMLYPLISHEINRRNQESVIETYYQEISANDESYNHTLIHEAQEYNKSITSEHIVDPFTNSTQEVPDQYYETLSIGKNDVMGYISIPKINVKLPIYHGTRASVLQKGVGHLESSSLPVGGEGTHAVLTAHRGLPSAKLFTDLDQLKEGDIFYISVLDEVLAYQVDQIKTVEPTNVEDLRIVPNQDYVTLATCTPYAINTHRLLVRGVRIAYQAETKAHTMVNTTSYLFPLLFISVSFFLFILSIMHFKKIRKAKKKQDIIDNLDEKENETEII